MRLILGTTLALVLAGLPVWAAADEPADGAAKAPNIVGLYTIVSGESDGKPIDAEHLEGNTVRITPETIAGHNKDQDEIYVANYTLNAEQDPCQIVMTASGGPEGTRGDTARGLLKQDGARLTLIYAPRGGQLPTEFKTQEGYGQILLVLERVEE